MTSPFSIALKQKMVDRPDEHGDRFGIHRASGGRTSESKITLIRDLRPSLVGVRELFPKGLPKRRSTLGYRVQSRLLPTIARALERRYPGLSANCEARIHDDGTEGFTYGFRAKDNEADLLIRYGLAQGRRRGMGSR
jgi:hypothetical protein